VRQLPASSRLVRAEVGDTARWTDTEHLLAAIFDAIQIGNWQRGHGKGQRPKPAKRPGQGEKRYGNAIPFDEKAREMFRRRRLGQTA
jgi:hypothetical protein